MDISVSERRKRRGNDEADTFSENLTEESEKIYRIPQNLEFGIELFRQNQPLPDSLGELYQASLAPVLEIWKQQGRSDFPELLFKKSYQMLCSRNPFFEQSEPSVPKELQNTLLDKKFLIRRGDNYYFQHDLVRAYLAAQYFIPRWRELTNEVTFDENWRSLLEFTLIDLAYPEEIEDLLFVVLDKNLKLAGKLFTDNSVNSYSPK